MSIGRLTRLAHFRFNQSHRVSGSAWFKQRNPHIQQEDTQGVVPVKGTTVRRIGCGIGVVIALAGCVSRSATIDVESPDIPNVMVEPLSLSVGVHYHYKFKGYQRIIMRYPVHIPRIVKLGPASVEMFDAIFRRMFVKVVPVDEMPHEASVQSQISGILVPEAKDVDVRYHAGEGYVTTMAYAVHLYAPDGTKIATLDIDARHVAESERSTDEFISRLLRAAMRSIAAQFVVGFGENATVRKWRQRALVEARQNQGKEE